MVSLPSYAGPTHTVELDTLLSTLHADVTTLRDEAERTAA